MKKISLFILCLTALTVNAQDVVNAAYPGHSYNFPLLSKVKADEARKFIVTDGNLTYEMPITSTFSFQNGAVNTPICVKNNIWKPGVCSLQSGSAGIFSCAGEKFYWRGDSIAFGDYSLKGIVVDTVKNVKMSDHAYRAYSDTVDVVFFKVQSGETGYYSLPSNDFTPYQGTVQVGKYAALILNYVKGDNGEPNNRIVGVAKWSTHLNSVPGVSGKVYDAQGSVMYFDDLETAKDVVLNMDNLNASISDSVVSYGLAAPTWNYLSTGSALKMSDYAQGNIQNDSSVYVRRIGVFKPSQEELDNGWSWRFETPDSTNAICDYYYKATDSTATIQYPELKSASQSKPNQYDISECNTWRGATCLYLVSEDYTTTFTKYRKYDGYLHVIMSDGSEYRQHLSIDKSGVITASGEWEKTKDATLNFTQANSYADNGKLQYFNLRFLSGNLGSSVAADKRIVDFATARKSEHSLTGKSIAYLPLVDTYIPYSYSNVKPDSKLFYCVYSILPKEENILGADIKTNGVVCRSNNAGNSVTYEKAYKFWLFKSAEGNIICYETNECGYISCIEWFE